MVPSQFPVENRPIYVHPVANMTAKTSEVETPKLLPAIKQIVDSRPTVKGIIHAVSYKLAHFIVDSMNDPRFITHNSTDRQEVLNQFLDSTLPLVLVSPSLERGVSLDGDKCRLIIIAKAPYLSLGDKIISARLYSRGIGNDWYKATMLLTLLQMAGRGVRSKEDYAETFILDDQARKAITERPGFLPSWWLDAITFEMPDENTKISNYLPGRLNLNAPVDR
jgi:Rad3-related DNA helicase